MNRRGEDSDAAAAQGELCFDAKEAGSGLEAWRAERARELERVCEKLGLPLNQEVEVQLTCGLQLRGILRLRSEELWAPGRRDQVGLRIDRATFSFGEIEAVVRLGRAGDEAPEAARAGAAGQA